MKAGGCPFGWIQETGVQTILGLNLSAVKTVYHLQNLRKIHAYIIFGPLLHVKDEFVLTEAVVVSQQ